jgi:hypothetical protein
LLHGRFPRFNSPDLSHAGSRVEKPGQFGELLRSAHRVDLHAAVIFIPDPASNTDALRVTLHEPAKSNALHATGNKPRSGLDRRLTQLFGSIGVAASTSA